VGRALLERYAGQRRDQLLVVRVVRGPFAGVPRGVDARLALEGVDRQSAVLAQHPLLQVQRLIDGLLRGVAGERVAVLDDLDRLGIVGQRSHAQPQRGEQIEEFEPLLLVACAKHQKRGGRVGHADIRGAGPTLRIERRAGYQTRGNVERFRQRGGA
jgi:hypothetical protein